MELKLEDFDNQLEQSIELEKIDEKSEQNLKLEILDEKKEVYFSLDNFDEEPKKTPYDEKSLKKPYNLVLANVDRKAERKDQEKIKKLRQMGSPLWGFLWRFFACCILINLSVWAYFHFTKGVSVLTGLSQIRSEIQTKMNKTGDQIGKPSSNLKTNTLDSNEKSEKISTENIDQLNRQKRQEKVDQAPAKAMAEKRTNHPIVIFSWINDKGTKVYSNKGFPENENYTDPKIEWR